MRTSIGIVFFWFGILKFFPGLSPAASLATRTLSIITFGRIPAGAELLFLALWECSVGALFMLGRFPRVAFSLFWLHMAGTALPILFFPIELFSRFPYAPTMEGQYVLKNLVVASAAFLIRRRWRGSTGQTATIRGEGPTSQPESDSLTTDLSPLSS